MTSLPPTYGHNDAMCQSWRLGYADWPCHRERDHGGDYVPRRVYHESPGRYGDWHLTCFRDGRTMWWPPSEARTAARVGA